MPLPMVHLGVAHALRLPAEKSPAYYLGSIAPDGIHTRALFTPEDKIRSHCNARRPEEIVRLTPLCAAVREGGPDRDFRLGYLVHVLTDLHWSDTLYRIFWHRYAACGAPEDGRKRAYYNDTDQLDFLLYESAPWREELWDKLSAARGCDIPGMITAAEADAWNERTLHWFDSGKSRHSGGIFYINEHELCAFIGHTAVWTERYLREKNII